MSTILGTGISSLQTNVQDFLALDHFSADEFPRVDPAESTLEDLAPGLSLVHLRAMMGVELHDLMIFQYPKYRPENRSKPVPIQDRWNRGKGRWNFVVIDHVLLEKLRRYGWQQLFAGPLHQNVCEAPEVPLIEVFQVAILATYTPNIDEFGRMTRRVRPGIPSAS